MKIENFENYVVLADDHNNLKEFASFLEFQIIKKFKGQNVVIDLTDYHALELEELLYFLKTSNIHRKTKQSFVLVTATLDPDTIPRELIVVPTLQEAGDIIEMEEIERDLGF
ncbi:MAG: ribonuclease Z [Bacteroidia bacterium]|nr:ribonuclease Z [Bacteroidia bacterium]NNF32119.1 ribonuclease Z [Flavobacteriaceae bacterium]MBT8274632.1 ribonuclease Z [Bacteroidia bacterium]NNJ82017.1 ribonuclease Z [Flavobacteriaceae bacterium]NNK54198.1 ribonuclease Z [Flavobacteriaceae bacterium]